MNYLPNVVKNMVVFSAEEKKAVGPMAGLHLCFDLFFVAFSLSLFDLDVFPLRQTLSSHCLPTPFTKPHVVRNMTLPR